MQIRNELRLGRQLYAVDFDDPEGYGPAPRTPVADDDPSANVVGSLVRGTVNLHAPVLDLDYEAVLVPSSTEGHFHLYLEKPISWKAYKRVLRAMAAAGLIERGFMKASIARKQTFVRLPGVAK